MKPENRNSEEKEGYVKVLFVYKSEDGDFQLESLWAEKVGKYYRVLNTPFFISNIAYHDIISVEMDEGELYFDNLIKPSGHSTIQMIIFNADKVDQIGAELVNMGCDWEGSHLKGYISIDVPANIAYRKIEQYLKKGLVNKTWDYKEACLSAIHRG